MNFATLSAADKRILIAGAVVTISALISFMDPSGSWGPIMTLSLLAGLAAAFIAVQPQVAPAMKLPAPKGLALLVVGVVAAGGFLLSALSYINYFFRNLADVFEIIFIVGMVAAIYLAWTGWLAYKSEGGKFALGSTPAPAAPAAPAASASPVTPADSSAPPPPPPPAEG